MTHADDLACKEFVELVTEYLEEVMPKPLRTSFEEHLEICSGCRLYLGQMRMTIRGLHRRREMGLSPAARDMLVRQFRTWAAARADQA